MAKGPDLGELKVKAQVLIGSSIAIGPGKADLLEAVARTGSIAAAGRELGFSYRRTRDMIDTLNTCWRVPLVEAARGGTRGGGAVLTQAGAAVLERYRTLDRALQRAARAHAHNLLALLGPANDPAAAS